MSEQPAEAPRSETGNVLNRKIGPLPLWAWMGLALASVLAYLYYKNRSAAASTASSTPSGTTGTSDVPQFVNQVYTQSAPPEPQQPNNPQQTQSVPVAPKGASATPYSTFTDFGWTAVPGSSSYKLRVYTVKGNHQVIDTTVHGLNYRLANLTPNTEYKWQIQDPMTGGSTAWMTFKTKPKAPVKKSTPLKAAAEPGQA